MTVMTICDSKVSSNMLFMFSHAVAPWKYVTLCRITCNAYFSDYNNIPWASFISLQVTSNWCFLSLCSIVLVMYSDIDFKYLDIYEHLPWAACLTFLNKIMVIFLHLAAHLRFKLEYLRTKHQKQNIWLQFFAREAYIGMSCFKIASWI